MNKTRLLCIGFALAVVLVEAAVSSEPIRVYEPGILTRDRYEIVGRLWVDTWRSAFQVPTHADQAGAVEALKAEAARRGANGLTNVSCLTDDSPFWGTSPHFCYALAIRVK